MRHTPDGTLADDYRTRVQKIVDGIERETIARPRRDETVPRSAEWVRRRHPHERPKPGHRTPWPRFHAFVKKVREHMNAAYRQFLIVYRVAADRLAEGDLGITFSITFPKNCFPPPPPYARPRSLEHG